MLGWDECPKVKLVATGTVTNPIKYRAISLLLPATPIDESGRLAALYRLDILDSPVDEKYDRITKIACEEFEVCTSLLTFVDRDRQWFKSFTGLDAQETSREISLCAHTILQEGCFVVLDAMQDSRFVDHPFVVGGPKFRFYAGCPIHDPTGFRIGSLCIIHTSPRTFDRTDLAKLTELASIVETEIATEYYSPIAAN